MKILTSGGRARNKSREKDSHRPDPTPRRGDLDLSPQASCHSDASQTSPPLLLPPGSVGPYFPSPYLFPLTSPDLPSHAIWPAVFSLLPPAEFANLSHLHHLPLSSAPTVAANSWEPLTPWDLAEVASVCEGLPVCPVEQGLRCCPVSSVGHRAGPGAHRHLLAMSGLVSWVQLPPSLLSTHFADPAPDVVTECLAPRAGGPPSFHSPSGSTVTRFNRTGFQNLPLLFALGAGH